MEDKEILTTLTQNEKVVFIDEFWGLKLTQKDINNFKTFSEATKLYKLGVRLYRYNLMKKLIEAKKFSSHWPVWLGKEIDDHIKKGLSSTKIMRLILTKYNITIRSGGLYKRIRKYKMLKKITTIGIESTALVL